MKHHGITKAEFRDKGSAGAFTDIPKLTEDSVLATPRAEAPKNPGGGQFFGGFQPKATIKTLDQATHAALVAKWSADTEIELKVTTTDGTTMTLTGLPETSRDDVQGASKGRVVYEVVVTSFSLVAQG